MKQSTYLAVKKNTTRDKYLAWLSPSIGCRTRHYGKLWGAKIKQIK